MSLIETLQALGRPIDTACNLIEQLLGEPFKIAGDVLSDHIREWQWKNRLKIIDRVNEIMKQREIQGRAMNPDFLLPFMRDCGDISSETMQETWAQLLTAAIDDESNEHIAFINTLRNLTATDVQVMTCMIDLGFMKRESRAEAIAAKLAITTDRAKFALDNFERLGLTCISGKKVTGFAIRFLRVCICNSEPLENYLAKQREAKPSLLMG